MNELTTIRTKRATWTVPTEHLPAITQVMTEALPPEDYDPAFESQNLATNYLDTQTLQLRKIDHCDPTSRGGNLSIRNTDVICLRCNQIKGALTRAEFDALMDCVSKWQEEAKRRLLARLRAGGRLCRN